MDPLVLIAGARRLSLDAALALARGGEGARWASVPPGADLPEGLAWLFPGAPDRRVAPPSDGHGDVSLPELFDGRGPFRSLGFDPAVAPAAHALAGALVGPPALVPGARIVGPDGAPLWRDPPIDVPALAGLGYEPEGVRGFLGAGSGPARFLSFEVLDRANRAALLALEPEARERRLGPALEAAGIDTTRLGALEAAVRPRIVRVADAPRLVSFLAPGFTPPPATPEERSELAPIVEALAKDPPADGAALAARLTALGPSGLSRRRRLLRWALTAQSVAPRVEVVYDLLGPERVLARLAAAGPPAS